MKSTFKIASALLLMVSSAAFAGGQPTSPATAKAPAATHVTTTTAATPAASTTPAASAVAPVADTKADLKAQKKQIRADEKTALAGCKKMKGAEKSACKKKAKANEATAMADLKAKK